MASTVTAVPVRRPSDAPPGKPLRRAIPILQVVVRVGLGAVFVWAGVAKAANIQQSVLAVDAYHVLRSDAVPLMAAFLPAVEIVAGLLLIAGLLVRVGAATALGLSAVFLVGMGQAMVRGLRISCGCFGGDGAGSGITWIEIGRDVLMLAAAAFVFARPDGPMRAETRLPKARRLRRGARDDVRRHARMTVGAVAAIAVIALTVAWYPGSLGGVAAPTASDVRAGVARTEPLRAGETVPPFSATGLGGGVVSWDSFAGRPAVLSVWAPWCPHCQVELPLLGRVAAGHPGIPVVTVVTAIGLHPGPDPAAFLAEHGLTFPTAVDDANGTISASLGIQGFPTLYYVGADGRVVRTAVGEDSEAAMEATFRQLERAA